jgi:hypothetical protein
MKIGDMPTEPNARTGELTPPGINRSAFLNASLEFILHLINEENIFIFGIFLAFIS